MAGKDDDYRGHPAEPTDANGELDHIADLTREEFRALVHIELEKAGISLDATAAKFVEDAKTHEDGLIASFVSEENKPKTTAALETLAKLPDYRFPLLTPTGRNVTVRFLDEQLVKPHFQLALQAAASPQTWNRFAIYDDFSFGADLILSRILTAEQVQVDEAMAELSAKVQGRQYLPSTSLPTPLNEQAALSLAAHEREIGEATRLLDETGFRLLDTSLARLTDPNEGWKLYGEYRRHDLVTTGATLAVKAYKAIYPLTGGIQGLGINPRAIVDRLG